MKTTVLVAKVSPTQGVDSLEAAVRGSLEVCSARTKAGLGAGLAREPEFFGVS